MISFFGRFERQDIVSLGISLERAKMKLLHVMCGYPLVGSSAECLVLCIYRNGSSSPGVRRNMSSEPLEHDLRGCNTKITKGLPR